MAEIVVSFSPVLEVDVRVHLKTVISVAKLSIVNIRYVQIAHLFLRGRNLRINLFLSLKLSFSKKVYDVELLLILQVQNFKKWH